MEFVIALANQFIHKVAIRFNRLEIVIQLSSLCGSNFYICSLFVFDFH